MEIEQEFSDVEKYKNYTDIVNTIKYLEDGGRVTEDWTEDHKSMVSKRRGWIPNFSSINEEREDVEFRKVCDETETIMNYLVHNTKKTGYFDAKLYLLLLKHMKKILDMLADDDEMNDLLSMMKM